MQTKKALLEACNQWLKQRSLGISNSLKSVTESLTQEEKSSAGDKHNTGRAMLQLEREKLGVQQNKLLELKQELDKIDPNKSFTVAAFGSLVKTNKAHYFISIPAAQIKAEHTSYFAIGVNAPIAKLLMGKRQGESFSWNGVQQIILEVC